MTRARSASDEGLRRRARPRGHNRQRATPQIRGQLDVDRRARKATRRLNTRPSHDLADYAGDCDHPGYRRITITHAEGKLNWAYRGMSEPLAHRHYDTFELPEAPGRLLPDGLAISFSSDREGNIAILAAPFEPLVKDIVFTRIAADDCTKSGLPSRLHRHVQPGSHDGRGRAGQ
jgi:hypothetical protein